MRWSKGFGIGLTALTVMGVCNALYLPDAIRRSLIPKVTGLPRNQSVILNWARMSGDPWQDTAWYIVDPTRATLSKWSQPNSPPLLDSLGDPHTIRRDRVSLSWSAQTQKILYGKNLIGLDGSITPLKIPKKGYDLSATGKNRLQTLSPDGKTVAYADDRYGERKGIAFDDIYQFDLKSRQSRQITRFGKGVINSIAWSPEGKSLAFMRQGMLSRINLDGSNLEELYQFAEFLQQIKTQSPIAPFIASDAPIRWSPDGRTIALLGSTTLWLFDVQTRQLRPLDFKPPGKLRIGVDSDAFTIDDFVWLPDGQQIAFSAGWYSDCRSRSIIEGGTICRHFLYQVNIHEGKLVQLTSTAQEDNARLLWVQKSSD